MLTSESGKEGASKRFHGDSESESDSDGELAKERQKKRFSDGR